MKEELARVGQQQQLLTVRDPETQALVQITRQEFLTDWAVPQAKLKLIKCSTELACIDSCAPSIGQIKRAFGRDYIQAYIESWIINLRMFFNLGRAMTDEQTMETAMLIVEEYWQLNIADINLIFKNAKMGRYGKIYDRLDGNIILEWFERYFNNRCNVAAEKSIRDADQYKGGNYDSPERVRKIIDSVLKKVK